MTFGGRLKELRKLKRLTQKEIAEKMGISYQAYGQYEKAENIPKYDTVVRLAKALDVAVDEVYGYKRGIMTFDSGEELTQYYKELAAIKNEKAMGIRAAYQSDGSTNFEITIGKNSVSLRDFLQFAYETGEYIPVIVDQIIEMFGVDLVLDALKRAYHKQK